MSCHGQQSVTILSQTTEERSSVWCLKWVKESGRSRSQCIGSIASMLWGVVLSHAKLGYN